MKTSAPHPNMPPKQSRENSHHKPPSSPRATEGMTKRVCLEHSCIEGRVMVSTPNDGEVDMKQRRPEWVWDVPWGGLAAQGCILGRKCSICSPVQPWATPQPGGGRSALGQHIGSAKGGGFDAGTRHITGQNWCNGRKKGCEGTSGGQGCVMSHHRGRGALMHTTRGGGAPAPPPRSRNCKKKKTSALRPWP